MTQLTPKQEAFAQAAATGKTQADAYRTAYSAGKMKAETVQQVASRLMADRKVAARVAELKAEVAEKALWTRLDSVTELADIARGGESKPVEKIAAIKELNLMHGFNEPTKLDHTSSDGSMNVKAISTAALVEIMAAADAYKRR